MNGRFPKKCGRCHQKTMQNAKGKHAIQTFLNKKKFNAAIRHYSHLVAALREGLLCDALFDVNGRSQQPSFINKRILRILGPHQSKEQTRPESTWVSWKCLFQPTPSIPQPPTHIHHSSGSQPSILKNSLWVEYSIQQASLFPSTALLVTFTPKSCHRANQCIWLSIFHWEKRF